MVQEVFPQIYRIPIPLPGNPLKELNAYFIRGTDGDLLIDTGFRQEPCRRALASGLKELNAQQERLDILLTHMHADHSGLAPEFVGRERNIYIGERDEQLIRGQGRSGIWKDAINCCCDAGFSPEVVEEMLRTSSSNTMAALDYDDYRPLRDGDVIDVGTYRLKALSTPGHTPGHMCFWIEEHGIMFTGDHVLFGITPNIVSWGPPMPNALDVYLKSLKAIRGYDVKFAFPAHRESGDFKARIDALERHHRARLAECLSGVRTQPGMTVYEIASRMTWKIRARSWEEFPLDQKLFASGECMSHLDYLMEEGLVASERDGTVNRYSAVK